MPHLLPRPVARAAAGVERLTWARRRRQAQRQLQVRPRPAARAEGGPNVPLCAQGWCFGLSRAQSSAAAAAAPGEGGGAEAKPAQLARRVSVPRGLLGNPTVPRITLCGSAPPPKLYLFL